ncbi:Peptidyl-prolyl cis-trans isomerase [hydrothermal vent metagenome]|uniref:peptidylprolyl isomerase n=1 Tax=hydrothermal vent metagenome TaxID=652676 RepID=A0A1W1CPZ7_9ZZZZ
MKYFAFLISLLLSINSFAYEDGVYAKILTTKGEIVARLFYKKTPITVTNFVALAEGKKKNTVRPNKPFYDGLTFHRVIKNFMIQGGDPEGTGRGGPGYRFEDEFVKSLRHNKAGILSMANSGPNTNGSQFFITHKATPWLDGKHTVFGEVVEGLGAVNTIKKGDKIKTIKIIRIGSDAKKFIADEKSFNKLRSKIIKRKKAQLEKNLKSFYEYVKTNYPNAQKTKSGLYYVVLKKGKGDTPKKGDLIKAHYDVSLSNGKLIDSSYKRNKPLTVAIGIGRVIKAWDEAVLTMKIGEKRILITPYYLAYGEAGRPPIIPPKSTLIFNLELISINNTK